MGPGMVVTNRGSVSYYVKCQNVSNEVFLRETSTCYYDLPVTFRGQAMFRDPRTFILKPTSNPVSCKHSFSIHKIGDIYLAQKPHFEVVDGNITKMSPKLDQDDIFTMNPFRTFGTMFGTAMDHIQEYLLVSVRRATATVRWVQAVARGVDPSSLADDDDEGLLDDARQFMQGLQEGFEQFVDKGMEYLQKTMAWYFFIVACIIGLMYVIALAKTLIVNGPRSSITARVFWALPMATIEIFIRFAQLFHLIEPRQEPRAGGVPLALRWERAQFDHNDESLD